MQIEKIVLHVSDVASLLGVSSKKVYEMIHKGELPAYQAKRMKEYPKKNSRDTFFYKSIRRSINRDRTLISDLCKWE